MNLPASNLYTASQIAACVGKTPHAVRKALFKSPAAGIRIVSGIEAAAWSIAQLLESLRTRLEARASGGGYRDTTAMLSKAPKRWEPPLPLDRIADTDIDAARKLREALRPWLVQQHVLSLSSAALESKGVDDYARVFGHRITGRYWRELLARTLRRDNGVED